MSENLQAVQDWMFQGYCQGLNPEIFFPEDDKEISTAEAICMGGCPVRGQCLDYALARVIEEGIWGGTVWEDRKAILHNRQMRPDFP